MKSGVKSALGYPILGSKRQDSGRQYRHQSYSHQGSSYSEDLRGFFSNRAPNYEDNNASHPYLARKLVAMLDVCQGEKVLDVATGTGYVALELARKLGSQGLIVGVDISKPMLQQARAKFDLEERDTAPYLLLEADIENIDFHGAFFNHITCSASLPYLRDLPQFFARARSWLLEGGSLAFNTPEVEKERESDKGDEIDDVEAHVEYQWWGMQSMPMVDFSNVEAKVCEAAYQQFMKEGVHYLNGIRDKEGKIFSKPLTTQWTIAR